MKSRDLLGTFVHHPVAANLFMIVLIVAGVFAASRLNVQFFPTFNLDVVTVRVDWRGAAAEDVEEGITAPLEQKLKTVSGLKKLTATSSQGVSSLSLELKEGTDPIAAVDQVKQAVAEFRNLPTDAEPPKVSRVIRYESVARLLVTGGDLNELRGLARRFERELLARGIDRVELSGLPEEEVRIEVPSRELEQLNLSLDQLATRLAQVNRDVSAGKVGGNGGANEVEREVRGINLRRDAQEYADLPVVSEAGTRVELGQVAQIKRQPREGGMLITADGKIAVELLIKRAEQGDSLKEAEVLQRWLDDTRPTLPPNVEIKTYDEQWSLIDQRIGLLVSDGLQGLILVVVILLLFLNSRVAFWVAMDIPTTFLASLAVLWAVGGSINMISLFAFIMALGIVVDDAIVVGEDAYAHFRAGQDPILASEGAARRMFWPVIAASLSTAAAFLPLMLISGPIGKIMFDIPFIMICVILASLVECFLILPGHLRHAFLHKPEKKPWRVRVWLDRQFERFQEGPFRRMVTRAVDWRGTTVVGGVVLLMLAIGLVAGGRLKFTFFPTPEPQIVYANATFASGTPRAQVDAFLIQLRGTLSAAEKSAGEKIVGQSVVRSGSLSGDANPRMGDQYGSMTVELTPSEVRKMRTEDFVQNWQKRIQPPAGLESFVIAPRRQGPPGGDIQVRFSGGDAHALKLAALELQGVLRQVSGVYGIEDDMPYGREQLIFTLTSAGEAMGLTVDELSRQLRASLDGRLVQIFQDGPEEVEVRVSLPAGERRTLALLQRFNVRTPAGDWVPLDSVARWSTRQGFEALRHAETQLAVEVTASVNHAQANQNEILANLAETAMPGLAQKYGVAWSFEGRAADQRETLADMRTGLILGLSLIYVILAWVFGHYGWPIVIMLAIPFGLGGAIFGHWVMGYDLTILSLFGIFGLAGVVINESIVLVEFYRIHKNKDMSVRNALINASTLRLRAILLTSLTTIGGSYALMAEESLQAQFLIPMAISITFGQAAATLLMLFWLPAMLSIYESFHVRLMRLIGREAA